jgi:hypothetical protein
MSLIVPFASFEVETVEEAAALGLLFDVLPPSLILELEVEGKLIDGDRLLTSVVLKRTRQEGLREEESREPVHLGGSVVDPSVKEVDPGIAVLDPGGQWLEGEETFLLPRWGHDIVKDSIGHLFKVLTHDDLSDESSLDLDKHDLHISEQVVVSDTLLEEHCVHGLLITGWVSLLNTLKVEHLWCLILDGLGHLSNDSLSRLTSA